MKLLSLWEPWASAIAGGLKKIETREWGTTYRGPLAIHASKRTYREIAASLAELPREIVEDYLKAAQYPRVLWRPESRTWEFPAGHIVCVCELADCVRAEYAFEAYPMMDNPVERALGNYGTGRRALVLRNIRPLQAPMAFSGFQGLRTLPPDIATRVYERAVA